MVLIGSEKPQIYSPQRTFFRVKSKHLVIFCSFAVIVIVYFTIFIHNNYYVSITATQSINKSTLSSLFYQLNQRLLLKNGGNNFHTNIFFLKTHKTGSSTMQNILMRFGLRHSLNVMLPNIVNGNYLGFASPIEKNTIDESLLPIEGKYNIFACHSRYHQNTNEFLYNDTVRVTLLRNPAQYFESLYNFYDLRRIYNVTFKELLLSLPNTMVNFTRDSHSPMRKSTNQMCYELGLNIENPNETLTSEFIDYVDREFAFVMITEYLDECLVLLADMMGWPLDYVTYLPLMARVESSKSKLSERDKINLRELNRVDTSLYFYFLEKFRERVLQYGVLRLMNNVRLLHKLNDNLARKCILEKTTGGYAGTVSYKLKSDADWECVYAAKSEISFINELREEQLRRFKMEKRIYNFILRGN